MKKFSFLIFVAFFSVVAYGQLFTPLGLGVEKCIRNGSLYIPQMHVEGDILYVCTNQGLYSKDLSNEGSEWQLVGFEGIPLQDYVRKEDDILALRYSYGYNENQGFFLLSHDGGKTYEDVTPDLFTGQHTGWTNALTSLVRHPEDPNTLLVSCLPMGLFQSSDFGQTWNQLTDITSDHIGYHPLNPQIIYICGEDDAFSPYLDISYDGGQTWEDYSPYYPGDNCISHIAFHPTDPDKWVAAGCGAVYTSADNGHTWNTQDYVGDVQRNVLWYSIAYDNGNSDILYTAGCAKDKIEVMYSMDGGMTWSVPQTEPMKKSSSENVNDFQQYREKLLVYTESDVYMISKADLIAQTTPVTFTAGQIATIILPTNPDASKGKYYRLDRYEDGQIIFEQELQPQAHIPYIIVPNEDFSIDLRTLDLTGLSRDTVSIAGISFIGSFTSEEFDYEEGAYIDIIDKTPDCRFDESCVIGALRAYLLVHWDDPYNQGGTRVPPLNKRGIVLRDYETGISMPSVSNKKNTLFDLQGRKLQGKPTRGIYIENGKKVVGRDN